MVPGSVVFRQRTPQWVALPGRLPNRSSRCRSLSATRFMEHGCLKLVESGCLRQTPRIAVTLLATSHRRSSRRLVGHRRWPLLAAWAHPLASTSGKGFRKAGTVYAPYTLALSSSHINFKWNSIGHANGIISCIN